MIMRYSYITCGVLLFVSFCVIALAFTSPVNEMAFTVAGCAVGLLSAFLVILGIESR